jgi:large subunit ribosomal protein L6
MSRIGKQSITIPAGVTVTITDAGVSVKGTKGELSFKPHHAIKVEQVDNTLVCTVVLKTKQSPALWGTTRAILANLIEGVSTGFTRVLEMQGVGYRASVKGTNLELLVGFSHPVLVEAPQGITFKVEKELITISGADKHMVGQIAANIRQIRKPEPYKGKGIRYQGEKVRRKVGKVVGATA